jgi:hypothetical protein
MDPLPAEAENVLRAFRRLVETVWKSKLARNPPRVRLSRTIGTEESASKCEMEGFDVDLLEAQLPRLRQFLTDGTKGDKSVRLERVINIVTRYCTNPDVQEEACALKRQWREIFHTEADQFEAAMYQMKGTLQEECEDLFYGFYGIFHINPHASSPEPNPFHSGRFQLALRPMFILLGEAYRLVGRWRGWPDILETGVEA